MSIYDKYFLSEPMLTLLIKYVTALQNIVQYKLDANDWQTPYQLETIRQNAHKKLFDEAILPLLQLSDGFDESEAYLRSKELFANLDKIWHIYDNTNFDLTKDADLQFMLIYLHKFLNTTETKYYLEGKTQYIHGIHM